ncbi:MAG TPA: O-methyltransferase, partial [Desulfitobacteriaceae bacterium]|nr:O-methyltransferase [Desulfitobacteriaceae bacterium]
SFALESFLENMIPERDALLKEMEVQALQETIPIITPAVGNYLAALIQTSQARKILEIGTAIGYSTLWLARASAPGGGHITTIDLNRDRLGRALEYFQRAGLAARITALPGDARVILPALEGKFDFIFIDAAKGEYLEYLELVYPLLQEGGLLVVDNVLFRGWVVPGAVFDLKYNRLVSGIREFLYQLCHDPRLQTSILPLGDGLALSIKLSDQPGVR